ncbi:GNAT family N-acetyltransferase [Candidatus Woesearchaeota archaeon]|nr:GNAT family N-acetyltransferase [Candidatus Woesearchaeota archaeon]
MKPILKGKRIILRKPQMKDSTSWFQEIRKIPKYKKHAKTKEQAKETIKELIKEWNAKKKFNYTILFDKKLIGKITIKEIDEKNKQAECGYWISPDFQRQGFAYEALHLILKEAFKKLNRIYFYCREENRASQKLLEKIGAKKEGILRESLIEHNKKTNQFIYSILKKEWK